MTTKKERRELKKSQRKGNLNELLDRYRSLSRTRRIELSDWERLMGFQRNLMAKVYGQPPRDESAITDRVLLFLKYVDEQPNFVESWKVVNAWRMMYPHVETYFNMKKYNMSPLPDDGLSLSVYYTITSATNLHYSELFSIMYRYKPTTIYEWIAGFVNSRKEKGKRYGQKAQNNFVKRVVSWELSKVNRKALEGTPNAILF